MSDKQGILYILEQSREYDTALLSTFNFDIGFFERAVLSRLIKNDIRNISVFVDADELTKALENANSSMLGQRYAINPVRMHGAYHPKVILLLGEQKARLIIGSANLKTSGYLINNEVFTCVDYDPFNSELRDVIVAAIDFFLSSYSYTPRLDNNLLEQIKSYPYYRPVTQNRSIVLIENERESVLEQLKRMVPETIREIRIAVPYYDNGLLALQAIKDQFPKARIVVYLQRRTSTFQNTAGLDIVDETIVFEKVKASTNNCHFYHGKVFEFITEEESFILFGSSNCTNSALTKSKTDGGNYECNLLVKGTRAEFDPFFQQFVMIEGADPEGQCMTYESHEDGLFFFKYGELEKELTLHVGYRKTKKSAKFYYHGSELWMTEGEHEILLHMEQEVLSTVFDLRVTYDGGEEKIRCWYNSAPMLSLFRIRSDDKQMLVDSDHFGMGEDYREDYEKLLRAEAMCYPELEEKNRNLALVSASFGYTENVEADDPESDSFIVQVDIGDEDYRTYQRNKILERIRGRIIERYLGHSFYSNAVSVRLSKSGEHQGTEELQKIRPRKATTEEKRFARFVKRRVSGMKDERFLNNVSTEHFEGLMFTVFEILDKYNVIGKVEGMFSNQYVLETRNELIRCLLYMLSDNCDENERLIAKILELIFNNHEIINQIDSSSVRINYEDMNRRLLQTLDSKYHLRSSYGKYLSRLEGEGLSFGNQERFNDEKRYIESLYGYKGILELRAYLKQHYSEDAEVEISETGKVRRAVVRVSVQKPSDHLRPDAAIVRELRKYSAYKEELNYVILLIEGCGVYGFNEILRVEHQINIKTNRRRCVLTRGSGKQEKYESSAF